MALAGKPVHALKRKKEVTVPEYLAPGVYVEEVSFRSKSIEGVSTTTTGFIGPARYGPVDLQPELLTSLGDFERIYGDGQPLNFKNHDPMANYLWHAVRAFFTEGGQRLYVVRTFRAQRDPADPTHKTILSDGYARAKLPAAAADASAVTVTARFPGEMGKLRLRFTVNLGQNVLGADANRQPTAQALQNNDIVWINDLGSPIPSPIASPLDPAGTLPGASGNFYRARLEFNPATRADSWYFYDAQGHRSIRLDQLMPNADPTLSDQIRVVTLTVTVFPSDPFGLTQVWANLPLDPLHQEVGSGALDSFTSLFAVQPANRALAYRLPVSITLGASLADGIAVVKALIDASRTALNPDGILVGLRNPQSTDLDRSFDFYLDGGNDGDRPTATEYEGTASQDDPYKTGLMALEDLEDISIVAAPGSTFEYEGSYNLDAESIIGLLIAHAQKMRYRIAVLDSGNGQTLSQVRAMRARLDSKYAALYYPWVLVLDPITRQEIPLPPSGFVTGIYARNDITRAVYKAPANEVVNLALAFELMLNKGQQDVLNPEGINCFRFFEGRGMLLWGARTISSDPEWKYVNLRRYFAYLEHSIDKGTQWAVFEPNGEALWANVRRTISDFLLNEWQSGALLGDKPEKAYFVRCDRSTMTQNDLDNGRLVCLIGVAPLRPAEYVIFRIGQWTADAKS